MYRYQLFLDDCHQYDTVNDYVASNIGLGDHSQVSLPYVSCICIKFVLRSKSWLHQCKSMHTFVFFRWFRTRLHISHTFLTLLNIFISMKTQNLKVSCNSVENYQSYDILKIWMKRRIRRAQPIKYSNNSFAVLGCAFCTSF